MTLRVVGAGLGRTGTMSLKGALERLLGEPCYHMIEVFSHPEHVPVWNDAIQGKDVDWSSLFDGYGAVVDWPACARWRDISEAFPDAVILLSTRDDADTWFTSAERTIFEVHQHPPNDPDDPWFAMTARMMRSFCEDFLDRAAATAAYERWNADVRAKADPARLVEWKPGDGWEPICSALGVDVPDEPFPHANSTEDFRKMVGWD